MNRYSFHSFVLLYLFTNSELNTYMLYYPSISNKNRFNNSSIEIYPFTDQEFWTIFTWSISFPIIPLCGSEKCTAVLYFRITGGDARIPTLSPTWGKEGFLESSLITWSSQGCRVFVTMVQVRLSDVKKIPQHCNNLTLEC